MNNAPQEYIERLIEEIEKRPPIYQKSMKEYLDVGLKKQLWDEVCCAVVRNWNELSAEEKIKKALALQRKWHNLRTCFARELRAQETTLDRSVSRRRTYMYYNKLLFLLPNTTLTKRTNARSDNNVHTDDVSDEYDDTQEETEEPPTSQKKVKVEEEEEESECEEQVLRMLKRPKIVIPPLEDTNCGIDEETNFVLSLVPTLKSLPEEYKLQARIEILSVLQRLKFGTQEY